MDFTLSGEQRQFAVSLHDMLAAADGPSAARSWAAGNRQPGLKIWRSLADAGVTALAVPADFGGLAGDPVDLVIACEEIGHHAVPGPVAESVAAVPALLAGLLAGPLAGLTGPGYSGELESWLGRLATGDLIATMAAPPLVPFAADAEAAGLVLVVDQAGVWAGVPVLAHQSVDAARTLSEIDVRRLLAARPGAGRAVARALESGTLACAAQLLGAGQALLDASVAHARTRLQFGQPVGSFQAVKHQLADVLIRLEFARPLLFAAAVATRQPGRAAAGRDVSAAKVVCADAAYLAARVALQVHGALGYTAEHDAGLLLAKVRALRSAWGSQAQHRATVLAALTCLGPGVGPGARPGSAAAGTAGGIG